MVAKSAGHVAAVVVKQQAVPLAQLVVVQVQAGVVAQSAARPAARPWGCKSSGAAGNDVAAGVAFLLRLQGPFALEHHGLAVAAHVGDQLHPALGVAHQGTALALLGQCVVIARVGHRHTAADVAGPALEDGFQLALEQRIVKIARNW